MGGFLADLEEQRQRQVQTKIHLDLHQPVSQQLEQAFSEVHRLEHLEHLALLQGDLVLLVPSLEAMQV